MVFSELSLPLPLVLFGKPGQAGECSGGYKINGSLGEFELYAAYAETLDVDHDGPVDDGEEEGDAGEDEDDDVGVVGGGVGGVEGEADHGGTREEPVEYLGGYYAVGGHHVADVGPDGGTHGDAEGEHEGHDAEHGHGDRDLLEVAVLLVVEVEEDCGHRVEEGQCEPSDYRQVPPLDVLQHGH